MSRHSEQRLDCDNTSSIITWLEDQPIDPAEYEDLNWRAPSTKNLNRRLVDRKQASSISSRRPQLTEITGNTMSDPQKKSRPPGQQTTKRKRVSSQYSIPSTMDDAPLQSKPSTPDQRKPASPITFSDDDPTPRAPATVANVLSETVHPGIAVSDRRSDLSSTSSNSIQTRSPSPTKRLGDFQQSDPRIELKDFGSTGYPTPAAAKALVLDLSRIGKGVGVIPTVFRGRVEALHQDDPLEPFNFASSDSTPADHALPSSPDSDSFWCELLRIQRAAQECQNDTTSEPEWNAEVHSRLLRVALEPTRTTTSGVWYRNVTVDRVRDPTLLPTIPASITRLATKMQSKMIDYVLMLEPDPKMHLDIVQMLSKGLAPLDRLSVNHIGSDSLRYKPIAVSIETKRAAIHEDAAHIQLSLWVAAHFAKLRRLASLSSKQPLAEPKLPILPLIIVQGHVWKLLVAHFVLSSSTAPSSIIILRDIPIGTTASILGCFMAIASLRRLMVWVNHDFQEWWKTILGGDESQV